MNATEYWKLFLETGAPEVYLSYIYAMKMEETNVPDNPRPGAPGHGLQ